MESDLTPECRGWRTSGTRWLAGFVVALVGCGGSSFETGDVRGTVGLGDKPLPTAAQIVFLDPTTGVSASAKIEDGKSFQLVEPLRTGTYRVFLTPNASVSPTGEPVPVKTDLGIPATFTNEAATTLKATVTEGENVFSVDLEKGAVNTDKA